MAHQIIASCTGCGACKRYCPMGAISGSKKKTHHIDPDLCIDCGTCGRICAFSAVLDASHQTVARVKRDQWARPTWNPTECVACNICVQACPTGVIETRARQGRVGFALYPYLADSKNCLGCGICADVCPIDDISMRSAEI